MAIVHRAKITHIIHEKHACILNIEMLEHSLPFLGGQFIIIDTHPELPVGKKCKRAYSLISADEEASRLCIAIYALRDGKGSGNMHALHLGDEIIFSGPWGKFHAKNLLHEKKNFEEQSTPINQEHNPLATVIIASATGITAALGLLKSRYMAQFLPHTSLLWFWQSSFLSHDFVQENLPKEIKEIVLFPPSSHPLEEVRKWGKKTTVKNIFFCGDGNINRQLEQEWAIQEGFYVAGIEHFFHAPKKSKSVNK